MLRGGKGQEIYFSKEGNIIGFKTDIEIAQECTMSPITEIAAKAGIDEKYLEQYGK